MRLSIIVPVYNIAHYLNDCVQSVLEQSFQDWELVLVNDGSTDQSPALCEEWAKKDQRIRVVHKTNGGLSDARNAGLLEAKGEYVHFLDGDDYYVSDSVLQGLMEGIEENGFPDTLLFCWVNKYEDTGFVRKSMLYNVDYINQADSPTVVFEHLLRTQRFNMSACFQLLKRECLMENQVFFEKGLLSEDVDWSIVLWQHLKTVKAVNCYAYCYRHRSASITTTLSIKNYLSYRYMFQKWIPRLLKNNSTLAHLQLNYLAYVYPTLLYGLFFLPRLDRKQAYELLREMAMVLKYSATRKSDRVVRGIRMMGFPLACFIFATYGYISKKSVGAFIKNVFNVNQIVSVIK